LNLDRSRFSILLLNSSSDSYGSSKIFLEVARIYVRLGIQVVVVLPQNGKLSTSLNKIGVTVKIVNLGILRRKYVSPMGLIDRLRKNLKAYRYLTELHDEFDFKLVYSNTLAVIVGAYWAQKLEIPHIWHIHEILTGPAFLISLLTKMLDKSTSEPIVVSQAVADHWSGKLKVAQPILIHNGIAYADYLKSYPLAKSSLGITEGKIVITMIGRINPGKGHLFFLELAKKTLNSNPNAHFLMVGDPYPGYEKIEEDIFRKIQDDNLQDSVQYLGFRLDIPQILYASDVFVLPSILPDSFPTVILEAMASGKPIVATRSGGASEMVLEGETGYLFPIGNVNKGVEILDKLIKDVNLRTEIGKIARNRVLQEYSLESFEKNIINHLWRQVKRN
jgi:glycosyltransferase involved in cell wall biosynthesis